MRLSRSQAPCHHPARRSGDGHSRMCKSAGPVAPSIASLLAPSHGMVAAKRPMDDLASQRDPMVERHIAGRGVRDPAVLAAMRSVPRERFLPPDLEEFAYRDSPLPIAQGQTISQPFIVALMTEALRLGPDDRVLEIGTGSGYAAAVLARIAREVYTIERHEQLAQTATRRLEQLGFDNVFVRHGDGTLGWPEHAPYDAIVVAAGGPRIPEPLLA